MAQVKIILELDITEVKSLNWLIDNTRQLLEQDNDGKIKAVSDIEPFLNSQASCLINLRELELEIANLGG